MSVIGRRAEGVARHSRRRPARDAGIETASKRHQNENGRRGARFRLLTNPTFL
ncbi:chorismate synthase [Burkholderia pseudomallei]|nr:chorismate synthase [Burkholderia pseudomallei]TOZ52968.1 chorismate synthase [Burkholderia pseudomallei]TPE71286.1 chorismate synthase [Burkholderia pseudomallei]